MPRIHMPIACPEAPVGLRLAPLPGIPDIAVSIRASGCDPGQDVQAI